MSEHTKGKSKGGEVEVDLFVMATAKLAESVKRDLEVEDPTEDEETESDV